MIRLQRMRKIKQKLIIRRLLELRDGEVIIHYMITALIIYRTGRVRRLLYCESVAGYS
jgi:hypothetical protein